MVGCFCVIATTLEHPHAVSPTMTASPKSCSTEQPYRSDSRRIRPNI